VSDRQLAHTLGTSQPTVSRRRSRVERELIDGYTVIPKWAEIGYEIVAFTFIRSEKNLQRPGLLEESLRKAREWFAKEPNVILAAGGEGLGFDGMVVSFHKNYSDYVAFKKRHDQDLASNLTESQSFIVTINPQFVLKPFHLKYLTDAK